MVFKKIFKILKHAFRLRRKSRRKRKRALHHKKPRRVIKRSHRGKTRKISRRVSRKRTRHISLKKKKKPARHKSVKQKSVKLKPIGVITHYFPKVNAAVVKLKSSLSLGEPVWIKGNTTDFKQTVGSIQIDRKPLEKAKKGQEIGLEVFKEVRPGDMVYLSK